MKTINARYLTFKEMQALYPDSWILVANPSSEAASAEISNGYFLYKNKNKNKVLEKSKEIRTTDDFVIKLLRIVYTGEIKLPQNHFFCL
jgi:hypothetical protein